MKTPYESLTSATKPFNFLLPNVLRSYLDALVLKEKRSQPNSPISISSILIDMVESRMRQNSPICADINFIDALEFYPELTENVIRLEIARGHLTGTAHNIRVDHDIKNVEGIMNGTDLPQNPYYGLAVHLSSLAHGHVDPPSSIVCHNDMASFVENCFANTPWKEVNVISKDIDTLRYHILIVGNQFEVISMLKTKHLFKAMKDEHDAFFFNKDMLNICAHEIRHGSDMDDIQAKIKSRFGHLMSGQMTKSMDKLMNHESSIYDPKNSDVNAYRDWALAIRGPIKQSPAPKEKNEETSYRIVERKMQDGTIEFQAEFQDEIGRKFNGWSDVSAPRKTFEEADDDVRLHKSKRIIEELFHKVEE